MLIKALNTLPGITEKTKKKFSGDNGGNLKGLFDLVYQSNNKLNTVYYGKGIAKVLMWKLTGTALVYIDIISINNENIQYKFKAIAFPSSPRLITC